MEVGNDKLSKVEEVFEEEDVEGGNSNDEDEQMEKANNKDIFTL